MSEWVHGQWVSECTGNEWVAALGGYTGCSWRRSEANRTTASASTQSDGRVHGQAAPARRWITRGIQHCWLANTAATHCCHSLLTVHFRHASQRILPPDKPKTTRGRRDRRTRVKWVKIDNAGGWMAAPGDRLEEDHARAWRTDEAAAAAIQRGASGPPQARRTIKWLQEAAAISQANADELTKVNSRVRQVWWTLKLLPLMYFVAGNRKERRHYKSITRAACGHRKASFAIRTVVKWLRKMKYTIPFRTCFTHQKLFVTLRVDPSPPCFWELRHLLLIRL